MPIPVPITLRLPGEAWVRRDPQPAGVEDADLLAVRAMDDGSGYSPILTVTGGPSEGASLTDIADDSIRTLATQAFGVRLLAREAYPSDAAHGIRQVLSCQASVDGRTFDLRQGQLVLAMTDLEDETKRAVVLFTVTCTADQVPIVFAEFEQFLASVKVDQPPV